MRRLNGTNTLGLPASGGLTASGGSPAPGAHLRWWSARMLLPAMLMLPATLLNFTAASAQTVEAAPAPVAPAKPEASAPPGEQTAAPEAESRRTKARKARIAKAREAKAREAKAREEKAREEKAREAKAREEKERLDQAQAANAIRQTAPQPARPATPSASPAQSSPAIAAKPSPPAPSLVGNLLFPRGSGFGLAMGLGGLWLILRWRSRRMKRSGDLAPPKAKAKAPDRPKAPPSPPASQPVAPQPSASQSPKPATRAPSAPLPAHREQESPSIALVLKEAEAFAGIPWTREMQPDASPNPQTASQRPMTRESDPPIAPPPLAPQPVSIFTPEPEIAPQPDTGSGPADAAPARAVFKPSALFTQIAPEPAPVAPPEPEQPAVEFPTIRFEVQRLALSMAWAELRFVIHLRNETLDLVDPLRLDACMGTPEGDLPETSQDHAISRMLPGQTITIAGEWRVPLGTLPSLRIGAVRLFVGAARIVATVEHAPGRPQREAAFLIGLPEEDGRLAPIPLDGTARIYDNLAVQSIAHG